MNKLPLIALTLALTMSCSSNEQLAPDNDKQDALAGVWNISQDHPYVIAAIPVENLGCPMGATITMRLESGSADVSIKNMQYSYGVIKEYTHEGRAPESDKRIFADIWGASDLVDRTLSSRWTILGADPLGRRESSASFLVVPPTPDTLLNLRTKNCADRYFGEIEVAELTGESEMLFSLRLASGESAQVTYDIEYFNCVTAQDMTADQAKVCDSAWDSVNDRVAGNIYDDSQCPSDLVDCDRWGKVFDSEEPHTEASIYDAVVKQCNVDRDVMLLDCC